MSGGAVNDDTFLNKLLSKRIQLLTTTLRSRDAEWKGKLAKDVFDDDVVLNSIISGSIKVLIDDIFPISEVIHAHSRMLKNINTGKMLLDLS
jgi:NADPH:quinone reductase-like Zn-dependent oxidoreductase